MDKIDFSKVIENPEELNFYLETYEKVKTYLTEKGPSTFWSLVRGVQGSDRRLLRLLNQMVMNEEIEFDQGNFLIEKEKEEIDFEEILSEMKEIHSRKPIPTFLFDQRPVTLKTTVMRAEYLDGNSDLRNKKIAVIGDDDLTSIAIALTHKAKEVIIFDIDERLIKFINSIAKEKNLNLNAYCLDLTKEIPEEFKKEFDVFLTDPTPIPEAFSLFVSIGIYLLKPGKGNSGYVSFFPSHQSKSLEFQEILTQKKVIITDMIPRITEYDFIKHTYRDEDLETLSLFDSGEERLSFTENLTRFETTNDTKSDLINFSEEDKRKMLGKATKRVLDDLSKDPAYNSEERDFVISQSNRMKENE